MVEGSYTGVAGSGGTNDSLIGINVPALKISSGGISAYKQDTGGSRSFNIDIHSNFIIGARQTASHTGNPLFKPEEVWMIDKKIDDGRPGYGKVMPRWIDECTNADDNDDIDTTYKLNNSAVACAVWIRGLW